MKLTAKERIMSRAVARPVAAARQYGCFVVTPYVVALAALAWWLS